MHFVDSQPRSTLFTSSFMTESKERLAPAKVNLGLHVLRKRPDRFHDIETVMVPIGWSDRLLATPSSDFVFTCSDNTLPTDETNLVVRAAKLLEAETGTDLDFAIHLDKRVPFGAGLGSGSSDAAATLLLLSEMMVLDLSASELFALAAQLGSDVPFFLKGVAALAEGRGDVLSPLTKLDAEPYRLRFDLVVAVPPVFISTAEAYRDVIPSDSHRPGLAEVVLTNDLALWNTNLVNDFEAGALDREPAIVRAKESLAEAGAGYASLSGSGAAVFGAFESRADALLAASRLENEGCRVWIEYSTALDN